MGKIFEIFFKNTLSQKISNLLTRLSNAESSRKSHGPGVVVVTIKKSNFTCVYIGNSSQYDSGERCGPWASCFTEVICCGHQKELTHL
jgi:hypothetical protein